MSRHTRSIPPDYFDARYAADPDPWRFETSAYERAKYDATLAALPRRQYVSALEIGCSIGVLTLRLAQSCDRLVATDVAAAALAQARTRCCTSEHVSFLKCQVPGEWPAGTFDLILLSEVIYYLDAGDLARLARRVEGSLETDGDLVLVHWTGETHYPLTGDAASERLIAELASCRVVTAARTDRYRLDVLRRQAPGSGDRRLATGPEPSRASRVTAPRR